MVNSDIAVVYYSFSKLKCLLLTVIDFPGTDLAKRRVVLE